MTDSSVGTVKLAGVGAAPSLRGDGPCLTGTLRALGSGARGMAGPALVKVKHDALDLLSQIVTAYDSEIAKGEVGADGSARAGSSVPSQPTTGLLYGRIQSGKTMAMIALVAAAIDNGFRVIIVLTSDNVKLVAQTTERFGALEGPIAHDALNPRAWSGDQNHISRHLPKAGVVFVCSKNKTRLDDLIAFLKTMGAPDYPALVLDDEADQATLDANLARSSRAQQKGLPAVDPTAIYSRVVENLRASLRHHVFLQVTATPYALLLQSVGTHLRPSFTRLLEPGEGYTGGEHFFEAEHIEGPKPPLVFVPKDESLTISAGTDDVPDGLRRAIAFFLVAAAAQSIADPDTAAPGQNFLCHTSQLRKQHSNLEGLVRSYVDRISDSLEDGRGEGADRLQLAYEEQRRTLERPPPLDVVLRQIRRALVNRKVVVVNAETDAEFGRGLNFIIGGNILGRGVTIDNLLVTYYLREPKTGQMDTMLQHARMYGYRANLMRFTRVFLPEQLAVRFHEIHCMERRLRRQLASADLGRQIVVEKASSLNPTRRTVLDPNYIDAFEAEEQVFPKYAAFDMKRTEYERIKSIIQRMVGGQLEVKPQLERVDYDEMLKLLELLPYDTKESSSWVPPVLRRVLERQRDRCLGRCYLFTRKMIRKTRVFGTGALSGDELRDLRQLDGPVLCALRDDGKRIPADPYPAKEFWYPTLVLDRGMPSLIVNVTPDAS